MIAQTEHMYFITYPAANKRVCQASICDKQGANTEARGKESREHRGRLSRSGVEHSSRICAHPSHG